MAKRRHSGESKAETTTRPPPSPPSSSPQSSHLPPPSHSADPHPEDDDSSRDVEKRLDSLLGRVASAASLSLAFLARNDLALHPAQSLALESLLPPPPPPPPAYWYLRFLAHSASDDDPRWAETFRMSRPSFYLLLHLLTPSLRGDAPLPPPDHKLAAALFRLAHAAPHAAVARRFGLRDASAACRAFYEVCRAACDRLADILAAAADSPPGAHRGVVAYCRFAVEGSPPMVAQAVVDPAGRFLDVSAGWDGGAMAPAQILPLTKLFELGGGGGYLLGGSCCPLLPWLLTPFENERAPAARAFNEFHRRATEVGKRAFQELRARWRLLGQSWKADDVEALPFVVVAGCLLHNFLAKCGEPPPAPAEVSDGDGLATFARFEGKGSKEAWSAREDVASRLPETVAVDDG